MPPLAEACRPVGDDGECAGSLGRFGAEGDSAPSGGGSAVKVAGRGSGRFDGFGVWSFAAGRGPFGAVVRVGLADGSARVARGETGGAGKSCGRIAGQVSHHPEAGL